jgi:hypothetical protein
LSKIPGAGSVTFATLARCHVRRFEAHGPERPVPRAARGKKTINAWATRQRSIGHTDPQSLESQSQVVPKHDAIYQSITKQQACDGTIREDVSP